MYKVELRQLISGLSAECVKTTVVQCSCVPEMPTWCLESDPPCGVTNEVSSVERYANTSHSSPQTAHVTWALRQTAPRDAKTLRRPGHSRLPRAHERGWPH